MLEKEDVGANALEENLAEEDVPRNESSTQILVLAELERSHQEEASKTGDSGLNTSVGLKQILPFSSKATGEDLEEQEEEEEDDDIFTDLLNLDPALPEFLQWIFSHTEFPELQIVAYGDFSYEGRFDVNNALLCRDEDVAVFPNP